MVRAVGYRGVPTPGLPFDERSGTIPHTDGRIEGSRNEYVVGWIKRGPTGVIGTNKKDSQDTVDTLLVGPFRRGPGGFDADYSEKLVEWLLERQPKLITDDHWKLIDEHERAAGEPHGPAAGQADQRRRPAAHRPRLSYGIACGGANVHLSGLFGAYITGNNWPIVGQSLDIDGELLVHDVLVDRWAVDDTGDRDELFAGGVRPRADPGDQQVAAGPSSRRRRDVA